MRGTKLGGDRHGSIRDCLQPGPRLRAALACAVVAGCVACSQQGGDAPSMGEAPGLTSVVTDGTSAVNASGGDTDGFTAPAITALATSPSAASGPGSASEPSSSEAGSTQPVPVAAPGGAAPNAVEPNAVEPNAVDPNAVEPNAVEPNAPTSSATGSPQATPSVEPGPPPAPSATPSSDASSSIAEPTSPLPEAGSAPGPTATPDAGQPSEPEPIVTFQNPLNQEFGSDPWMTYYDGFYYLSATTWDNNNLTMKRGRTIAELKQAEPQVIWQPGAADTSRSRAMWAPEFFLFDNGSGQKRWYFYFTAGDGSPDFVSQRPHVLESTGTDPMGPYTFRSTLLNSWAIDGSVLEVEGKLFFMYSAWEGDTQNVYVQAMSNPWTLTGNRTRITRPDYAWEREGTAAVNEGPEALYRNGRTFVTYSASQCGSPGYKLGLLELTGSNPLDAGAWAKSAQPVFQAANGNYSTAHNGFFRSPDGTQDWLVYHGVSNPAGSCWVDRTTRIQPFGWNADGTPDFGQPLSLDMAIVVPAGE